jgi:SOS response regulatory protein OraA/RecX
VPTVTALHAAGRDRVAVELDGGPWRTIPLEAALRVGVATGVELDRPRLRALRRELRRGEAVGRAARALRSRDRTARELDDRLGRAGIRAPERAVALATLERAGLVDDGRVAAARAAALADRGRGDAAIRWELERAGVAPALVERAVTALPPERERAERVLATARSATKAAALLARRGFDPETIESVVEGMAGADEGGEVG